MTTTTTTAAESACTCELGAPCTCGAYDDLANRIYLRSPAVPIPCPDWCGERRGHGYDQLAGEDLSPYRDHGRTFGERREPDPSTFVDVVAGAVYDDEHGGEQLEAPRLMVWIGGDGHDRPITDPTTARELAGDLLRAADLLETLQSEADQ